MRDQHPYGGPLFLTGMYRSGTSLVSQVLNNHPKLRVIYDNLHFFRFYLGKYLPIRDRYADIVREAEQRLNGRWGIHVPADRILERLGCNPHLELKDVYDAIMVETFCHGREDIRWGEKSLIQWSNIPLFLQMFPTGQTIQIIRDPRDVLASYREHTNETPFRYLDAVFAYLHCLNWAATTGASLADDRYMLLRHEDLVTHPEETARKMCAFLRIPYDPAMFDFSGYKDQRGDPWDGGSSFGDSHQAITPVSVGRWRSKLQPFETAFAESVLGDLLPAFGYELSGVKIETDDLRSLWQRLRATPLLQSRLRHWFETGQGVESYPSDPTDPANWDRDTKPA